MLPRMSLYMLKRISRDLVSLAILFITPLVLITILGLVADEAMNELLGLRQVDVVAVTMILAFQLFAGFYTLELMQQDLLKDRKWRIRSLPIPITHYMYSILIVTVFYGGLQSYALTQYTRIVYDVTWGDQLRLVPAIFLISLFIQSVYLNIALYLKNFKTMERTATGLGLFSMLVGGVWFQMPDQPILNFLGTYGNPFSLAQNILIDGMRSKVSTEGLISTGILVFLILLLNALGFHRGRSVHV